MDDLRVTSSIKLNYAISALQVIWFVSQFVECVQVFFTHTFDLSVCHSRSVCACVRLSAQYV